MEAPVAASFWTFIVFSVVIRSFITNVECSNRFQDTLCPQKCYCNASSLTVDCTNAEYRYVPFDLPSGTRNLILDGNLLYRLTNESLSRLVGVSYLSLRNCSITDVEDKGFSHLSESLRVLYMSDNPLKVKPPKFLVHLRKLESLDLSLTGVTAYPRVLKKLSNLKQVILVHNLIKNFPQSIPMNTKLESLDLSENLIEALSVHKGKKAAKHSKLKNLSLSANKIRHLDNHSVLLFPQLELLDLSQNQLREVQPLAFISDSLKVINLHNTKFRLDEKNWNIFQHSPNIERIDISFCRIKGGNLSRLAFRGLRNLKELDLSGTGIRSFSEMSTNLPKLAKLNLSSNLISSLGKEEFAGIADSLRELNVSSCRISTINYGSLPSKVWKNLRVVDFSENSFLCDCDFIWLRRWLKRANASKVEVRGWDNYYCQTSKGQVSMFQLERPSDTECFQDPLSDDPYLVVIFLLTLLIWITSSSASALHRFRWHLRYWYFLNTVSAKKKQFDFINVKWTQHTQMPCNLLT